MKNLLVLLVITASWTAQAQQASCLKLSKIRIADHLLHQAGETRAELIFKARDCYVVGGHDNPTVTFEDKPGLQATLSSTGFAHIDQESVGAPIVKAREMSLVMKLKASAGLPLGEHSLHAMVTYQRLDGSGAIISETVAVQIPFKVAPPKPYNPDHKERSGFIKGLELAGEIVLAVPALLIMAIWCPLSGTCPVC